MPTHPLWSSTVMEAAEDVEDSAADVVALVRQAAADGIDHREAADIERRIVALHRKASAVVAMAEQAVVRELTAIACLRPDAAGQVNASLAGRARELRVPIPLFIEEPGDAA